mgnify:CR=1 FL=1
MAQASGAAKNGGNYRKHVTVSTPIKLSSRDQFDWPETTKPFPYNSKSQDQTPHHFQAIHPRFPPAHSNPIPRLRSESRQNKHHP